MVNRYNPRRRLRRHLRENKRAKDIISSLPDDLLQHIISFVPTKFAIRTSVLSKRWRHIWSINNTPSLYFDISTEQPASIDETLMRYTSPKMKQFHLKTNSKQNVYYIERWIELATSRNVEYCHLEVPVPNLEIPRCFFINSSLKQLNVELAYSNMIHRQCIVSWPSLKKLSLRCCSLPDDSIAMISSGCPILECLTLYRCKKVRVLDLSKLLQLRTLEIILHFDEIPTMKIVAPQIHCLRLITSQWYCALVDISSLTEANLDICFKSRDRIFNGYLLQDMVLDMLETLQNVEKLTIGGNFLQILSLAEFHGVSVRLPMLKVKTLTLETVIFKYVVPGIERLLQNSPDLEKLIVRARDCNTIPGYFLMEYLNRLGLDPDKCWRSKDGVLLNKSRRNVESKHVTSFIEIMLKNTKKLDKMFIQLDERDLSFRFKDLVPTLPPNNNVSISLSTKPKI